MRAITNFFMDYLYLTMLLWGIASLPFGVIFNRPAMFEISFLYACVCAGFALLEERYIENDLMEYI